MPKAYEIARNKKVLVAANYLSWYLEIENDYSIIDKLARARSENDVIDAIYAALRVKARLAKKAVEEKACSEEKTFLDKVVPGRSIMEELLKLAGEDPKATGGVLAILALSMHPYIPKEEGES